MALALRLVLAAVLAGAALAKLTRPGEAVRAFDGLGLGAAAPAAFGAVVAAELALGLGVALGSALAAYAAAALLAAFALVLATALRRGLGGRACACFGPRSTVSRGAVGRNVALAAAFATLPAASKVSLTLEGWLAVGVVALVVAVAVLGVAVLALAREVGLLRLRLPPTGALELEHEGPPVGEPSPLARRFRFEPGTRLALAVFSSPGCGLCRRVAPAIAAFAREPDVSVRVFDEEADADAWRELGVPGSPFAVALDPTGVVRAKGAFNSYGQLESVLAAAERRVLEAAHA